MTRQSLINKLANDRDIKQTQTKVNYLCEKQRFSNEPEQNFIVNTKRDVRGRDLSMRQS